MAAFRIAVIGGDGIGPEVIDEAIRVSDAAVRHDGATVSWNRLPWGSTFYKQTGRLLPADGWAILPQHDAILFGAIGSPDVPDHIPVHELLLPMRRKFDQYVNLRPMRLLPGVRSPLVGKGPAEINMVCIRENTEGEYAGVGGRVHQGTEHEVAIQSMIFTRAGTERIIRYAFEYARQHGHTKVMSATKSNSLQYSMVFWDEVFSQVAADYPDIIHEQQLIDSLAARFVSQPESLQVIVASNLFGDILTDLGAAISGSLGLAPSANINPQRR